MTKECIAHPYPLQEAYEAAQAAPALTYHRSGEGARLDFIWCSRWCRVEAVLRPLCARQREFVLKHSLPNRAMPSDHLPVGAVLQL